MYLEVSEGGSQLGHVQGEAPGRASGAVDLILNILLFRWAPARARHGGQRAQQRQSGPTSWHCALKCVGEKGGRSLSSPRVLDTILSPVSEKCRRSGAVAAAHRAKAAQSLETATPTSTS